MEEIELEQIAKKFSIPMVEQSLPADEELETLISQRAVFLLEARLRKADNIQKERMQRFMRTVSELAANDEARALLAMLVDEFYQSTFHAPLEQPSDKLVDMVRPKAQPRPARPAAPAAPVAPVAPAAVAPVPQEGIGQEEQPEAAPVSSAENPRPEGEKRRRKRSRKKPAGSVDAASREQSRPETGPDAPVALSSAAPVAEGVQQESSPEKEGGRPEPKKAPRQPQAAAQAAPVPAAAPEEAPEADASVSTPDQSAAADGQPAAAPKKRRRRRPRKSNGAKPEGSGDGGAPAAPAPSAAKAPAAPAAPAPAPRAPRGNSGPKPTDSPEEGGASRPRETPRPARKKAAETKTEPPKPKKKIFLE